MIKRILSFLLVISMIFSLSFTNTFLYSAEDASSSTVAEWDFTKIPDGDYGFDNAGPVISSDENIILGHNSSQTWWNQWKGWNVNSGVLNHTNTEYSSARNQLVMALKVDSNFKQGVTYTLETDLEIVSHGEGYKIPKWLSIYYSPTLHNGSTTDSDEIPDGSMSIFCNGSYAEGTTFTTFPSEFTFSPDKDYSAGGYIMIRVGMSGVEPAVIKISKAKIVTTTISSTVFKWNFSNIADGSYGMANVGAVDSSDGNITLGCSGSYWNSWTGWNVESGVLTGVNDLYAVPGVHHIVSLKVGTSLKKDIAYNLITDLEVVSHGEGDYIPKWCHIYYTSEKDNYYRADANPTQDYETIYYVSGGFTTLPKEFLFTLENDYSAGGYITIRIGMGTTDANTVIRLSSAELSVDSGNEKIPAPKPDKPTVEQDGIFYDKIVLPEIDTSLMEYVWIKGYDEIKLYDNTIQGLGFNTECKIATRYIDSKKYYEGALSDTLVVKTRKKGDTTNDGKVNLVDLVRMKKEAANNSENMIYDINLDDKFDSEDLVYERQMLLGTAKELENEWRSHPEDYKLICFTFDDGPTSGSISSNYGSIVNTFNANYGKATFFTIGTHIEKNGTNQCKYALSSGHEIANHSYSHAGLSDSDATEELAEQEIIYNQELIKNALGVTTKFFRAGGTSKGEIMWRILSEINMPAIRTNSPTFSDWSGGSATEEQVKSGLLNHTYEDGSIVLLHATNSCTANALKTVLPTLYEKGYRFCTLSEYVELRGMDYDYLPKYEYIDRFVKPEGTIHMSYDNPMDKAYITLVVDDNREDLIDSYNIVVKEYNFPLCAAVNTWSITSPKRNIDLLHDIENHGGEILSHTISHYPLNSTYSEEVIKEEFLGSWQILREYGYNVNGIITAGGSGLDSSASFREYLEPIISQRYYYSDAYGVSAQYYRPRKWLGEKTATSCYDNIKNIVDNAIENKSWEVLYWHNLGEFDIKSDATTGEANFIKLMNYLKEKEDAGLLEVVTYKDVHETVANWSKNVDLGDTKYTVDFYSEDGQTLIDSQVVVKGKSATAPDYTAPEGKTFKKWSVDVSNVTDNIKAYAVCE